MTESEKTALRDEAEALRNQIAEREAFWESERRSRGLPAMIGAATEVRPMRSRLATIEMRLSRVG